MKIRTFSLLVSLVMIFMGLIGCSKQQVLLNEQDSKLLNYNFKIQDLDNIDKTLKKQKYGYYTKDINKKYVAVITYKSKDASIEQFIVDNNGTQDITIPKDAQFIISMYRNITITSTWNIRNDIDNGVIQFDKKTFIEIPPPGKINPGENYDRQNLYFKCLKTGNEKIVLKYENDVNGESYYQITFNVKVE